jgi:hypothetical protein
MDTQEAAARVAWEKRDEWLRQFDDELTMLRRRPTGELVLTVAHAFHADEDPRAAAREYHQKLQEDARHAALVVERTMQC